MRSSGTISKWTIALTLLCAIATTAPSQAQPRASALVGGGIGVAFGSESADVDVYASQSECGRFEEGSAIAGSIDGRMVLPMFFTDGLGVDARLRLSYGSARLTASPVTPTTVRSSDGSSLVELDREFRLERRGLVASLDVLARASLDGLVLGAGVALGARISPAYEQTDNILGPGAYRWPDGQTELPMRSSADDPSAIVLAPILMVGYAIPVAPGVQLVPELTARFDLLSSVGGGSWRSTELGIGAAVLFDVTPSATPIVPGPGEE